MILRLKRTDFTDVSTIGELSIDGTFFCYVLEDKDRGLLQSDLLGAIKLKKLYGITAIPKGTYKVKLSMSNRFKRLLPEILDVKGFEGVRIHRGNTATDSLGCLILGFKKAKNSVFESTKAELALMEVLKGQTDVTLVIE
mgnify:CR=1 FL=1|nr:DUF5675 family protein [uncultured Flavobacterium sp.]